MLRAALTSALHGPASQRRTGKPLGSYGFPGDVPAVKHRCDVYAAGTNSGRPAALCCNRATSSPHPWRPISRLRPRFCATRVPRHSRVPRPERVIARTLKSSTRMVSKRRARSVVVFSTQSRRRSASRARTLAMASLVRARRGDPRRARATAAAICGAAWFCRYEDWEPAAALRWTAPPRPLPRDQRPPRCHRRVLGPSRGSWQKRCASARAIKSDSVGLHGVGEGAGPAEPHPPDFGYPDLSVAAVEPLDVTWFDSDLAESFMFAGLAPRRATVSAVKEVAHRLGEVPQRYCCTVCDPAASHSHSARAAVNWAHCSL